MRDDAPVGRDGEAMRIERRSIESQQLAEPDASDQHRPD
jgi:hypothetical protein